MEHRKKPKQSQDGNDLERKIHEETEVESSTAGKTSAQYIHYIEALRLLSDRVHASSEEIVGWVMFGSEFGGLDGYQNPATCTLGASFSLYGYDGNYLSLMMECWFLKNDIINFHPEIRFITGKELIKRWNKQLERESIAFIQTMVGEGQLHDFHPGGRTRWHSGPYSPSKKSALFTMSEVNQIEANYFFRHGPMGQSGLPPIRRTHSIGYY
jgi:hypothetical protein